MAGAPATTPQLGEQPVSLGGYSPFRVQPFSARHAWASRKAGPVQRVSCFGLRKGQSGIPAPPMVDQPHGGGCPEFCVNGVFI